MKNQQKNIFILITIIGTAFFGCDGMATLFHGPKPEPPPVTYTVTFNANGAVGTPPATQTVNEGTVISFPDKGDMNSTGNIFAGWNESSSGGGITYSVGASVTVTKNMVFYAQWLDSSTPQYTVTFNANGATSGASPASQTVYSGISITVPAQGTLAYSGKTFGGWNTQSNGGGTNYAAGATFTVTENVTLYAKWQSEVQYTVTYNANGASGAAPTAQTVDPGTVINLPGIGSMSYLGKTFEGWNTNTGGTGTDYAEGAAYTVNTNVTLYAKWLSVPIEPPGTTLVEKLAYIRSAAGAGVGLVYDVVVNQNEYINTQSVTTMGQNVTVIIRSSDPNDVKSIQLQSEGNLLSITNNITLKLQDITLVGISTNNDALVLVGQGGTLTMNSGAKVTLNTITTPNTGIGGRSAGAGGGIRVNGGTLVLNEGSEIIGNKVQLDYAYAGGIYVENSGNVVIQGGLISENKTIGGSYSIYHASQGGGIYINGNSTVTMSGGTISKNSSTEYGGGISITSGSSFTKRAIPGSSTSGIIYGGIGENANTASSDTRGHAIYRNFGTLNRRNTNVGLYDEITSINDVGWE